MKMPLSPVLNIFGSTITLFDVSHGRDDLGRPAPPLITPNRTPRGIIQPSGSRTLEWAARAGILTQGGLMTLHTKAAVHIVDLQGGALSIDAVNRSLITGTAPNGVAYILLDIDGDEPVEVIVADNLWSYAPPLAPSLGVTIHAAGYAANDSVYGGEASVLAGSMGTGAGVQTYVRRAGKLWKAWGVGDWRPHTNIGRYILTQYFDSDAVII